MTCATRVLIPTTTDSGGRSPREIPHAPPSDNCLFESNPLQEDENHNGIGEVCECENRDNASVYDLDADCDVDLDDLGIMQR